MPSPFNLGPVLRNLRIGKSGRGQGDAAITILKDGKLKFTPRTAPTSCALGDMYVDSTGTKLKICTTAGTPGTWTSVGAQT